MTNFPDPNATPEYESWVWDGEKWVKDCPASGGGSGGGSDHDHKLDDLSDVNAGSPNRDDLLIWNGSNWVADDFAFIQTALRFKGGIAPTATAPAAPENGDLYVFNSNGTVDASWGAIGGTVVQAGKFAGYAAGSNNRWFLLGDMADGGVMKVEKGTGILVDSSKPSEPVVSADFGTTSSTVARGNHNHTGVYQPVGSYATASHTHSQYLTSESDPTVPSYVKTIKQSDITNWNKSYTAGCYYNPGTLENPTLGKAGLVYAYSVDDVVAMSSGIGSDTITIVKFSSSFPARAPSNFAFNFTVVSATGRPTLLSIGNASDNEVGFIAWQWIDGDWELIPALQCGFTLMVAG